MGEKGRPNHRVRRARQEGRGSRRLLHGQVLLVDIRRVVAILKKAVRAWKVPAVGVFAEKRDPFLVLVSCILSLRTRDATTLEASRRLFALAKSPARLAALPVSSIQKAIYPVSFYRVKARSLKSMARQLLERFGGRTPGEMEDLLSLPGVGRKTANLVLTLGHGKPGICVDTHVHRISNRLGYVKTRTPDQTEMALRAKLPKPYWMIYNDLLVPFGQNICQPLSPLCGACPLARLCPRLGVKFSR